MNNENSSPTAMFRRRNGNRNEMGTENISVLRSRSNDDPFVKTKLLLVILFAGVRFSSYGENDSNSISESMKWLYESIRWGVSTNGLQVGVRRVMPALGTSERIPVIVHLCNTNAVLVYGLLSIPANYRVDLSLFDSTGSPVGRTSAGNEICGPITPDVESLLKDERRPLALPPSMPFQYQKFDVADIFSVTNPGSYTLVVHANLFRVGKYPEIERIYLPPTSLNLAITEADLEKARTPNPAEAAPNKPDK
jgi:hypothetical protein